MDKVISFFKKYWITIFIYIGLVVLYKIIADNKLVDAFLFPPVDSIIEAFQENKGLMLTNMLYSFQLMIPSIIIAVAIALTVGTVLGMNQRIREVLHPVIYTISVVPSILLSPFALLLAPNFRSASLFLVVYGTIWSTLFATITGIQTIEDRKSVV